MRICLILVTLFLFNNTTNAMFRSGNKSAPGTPTKSSSSQSLGTPNKSSSSQNLGTPNKSSSSQNLGTPNKSSSSQSLGTPNKDNSEQNLDTPIKNHAPQSLLNALVDKYVELLGDQFKDGDLFYGLEGTDPHMEGKTPRRPLIKKLREQRNNPSLPMTADDLNNIFSHLIRSEELADTSALEDAIIQYYKVQNTSYNADDRDFLLEYGKFLAKQERYHPLVLTDSSSSGEEELKKIQYRNDWNLKKACKAGVLFTHQRKNKIYFLLDQIDLSMTLTKANQKNYKGYTNSELRFIFKMSLKDPSILETVLFYQGGVQVNAPWLHNEEGKLKVKPDWEKLLKPRVSDDSITPDLSGNREYPEFSPPLKKSLNFMLGQSNKIEAFPPSETPLIFALSSQSGSGLDQSSNPFEPSSYVKSLFPSSSQDEFKSDRSSNRINSLLKRPHFSKKKNFNFDDYDGDKRNDNNTM